MIYVRRTPSPQTHIPHLDLQGRGVNRYMTSLTLTNKELALLKPEFTEFNPKNKEYDLVYIVKEGNGNTDLKYSLRSICKFCEFRKVWIVGYKPNWVKDVGYIHTLQKGNKWKNSMLNYEAACNHPEISDNFVLMNDDFFAIRQIVDWEKDTNKCLGTIPEKAKEYRIKRSASRWQNGFIYAEQLLNDLGCKQQYNYETHLPIIINKNDFKIMLTIPAVQTFMKTDKVFHKRSIYKNLFYKNTDSEPQKILDVKLELQKDLDSIPLTENWVSVYDYVVDNVRRYPQLNKILRTLFAEKCRFEV